MVYSDVVKNKWILPKKAKYTLCDVRSVQSDSLFRRFGNHTLSAKQAAFVVKCSAVYWDTDYSKTVARI